MTDLTTKDAPRGAPRTPPVAEVRLVYGASPRFDALVFLTESDAEGMAADFAALRSAATLREAAAVTTRVLSNPARQLLDDDDPDDPAHAWDEPLVLDDLVDGDGVWPPMLPLFSDRCLPEEVSEEFGVLIEPAMSAEYSLYPEHEEGEVLEVLTRLGYVARRDDELIARLERLR